MSHSTKTKIFKVIVISFLVVSLLLGLFSSRCFSDCSPGDCFENPIIIDSIKDLETFAQDLDEGSSYLNKFVALKSDISIGKNNKTLLENLKKNGTLFTGTFNGNLNGNGHTITINATIDFTESENVLFNSLGRNAEVKNLKVKLNSNL